MASNYGVDGVSWEEISKWKDRDIYCRKIYSRFAFKKKKKWKKLLKKDVKPREHSLKLDVLKKRGVLMEMIQGREKEIDDAKQQGWGEAEV